MASLGEVLARDGSSFIEPRDDPPSKALKLSSLISAASHSGQSPITSYNDPSTTACSFFWSRV